MSGGGLAQLKGAESLKECREFCFAEVAGVKTGLAFNQEFFKAGKCQPPLFV